MRGRKAGWVALLVLLAGLLLPGRGSAGLLFGPKPYHPWNCPPRCYSCWHYWAPAPYRIWAGCHGPKVSVYPPDRFPCVPPSAAIIRFPCPGVPPPQYPYAPKPPHDGCFVPHEPVPAVAAPDSR
jgi:hypothetical protein